MLTLSPAVRIFLCTAPVDLRRGFDGLHQLTRDLLRQDPTSGHLFVFHNRRRDRVKLLYWDRDGFALWSKRLERGTFRFPAAAGPGVEVQATELALLLGGIDPAAARRRPRFVLPPRPAPPASAPHIVG